MKNSSDIRNKGFHITKWFLDFIGPDGTVMIAYAARLTWHGISVPYASMLWYLPGEPVKEKNRYTRAHMPKMDRDSILWDNPDFKAKGIWETAGGPIEARLYESEGRHLDWHCFQPRSRVHLSLNDRKYRGEGYAEVLTMNFPTWEIPLRELRWGHVSAQGNWCVWIEMKGGNDRQWVWWNGTPVSDCEITDEKLHLPGKGLTIFLEKMAELGKGKKIQKVVSKLAKYLPGFKKLIPEPFLYSDEHKWCSKATITGVGESPLQGWAVHEFVNFNLDGTGTKGRKSL